MSDSDMEIDDDDVHQVHTISGDSGLVATPIEARNDEQSNGTVLSRGVGEGSSSKAMTAAAGSPGTPTTPGSARKENVWRSVFHPGSNIATRGMGTNLFDKPSHPNAPTVYDWLYSDDTRSQQR